MEKALQNVQRILLGMCSSFVGICTVVPLYCLYYVTLYCLYYVHTVPFVLCHFVLFVHVHTVPFVLCHFVLFVHVHTVPLVLCHFVLFVHVHTVPFVLCHFVLFVHVHTVPLVLCHFVLFVHVHTVPLVLWCVLRLTYNFFRSHYIVEEIFDIVGGAYYVTPTTYNAGREGVYNLTISTDCVFSLDRIAR